MRIVHKAVQNSVGVSGIANDLVPRRERELGGDNRRSAAITLFEDFEQVMTGAGVEGFEAEVVENEQIGAAEGLDEARMAAIASGKRQVLAEFWPAMIEDRPIVAAGFLADGAGQLLPTPDGPTRARLSWASVQSPSESFWNRARSSPRVAR